MARRDSNIDPFNAGEPILPWRDPESEIRDADEEEREPYEAPRHGDEAPEPSEALEPDLDAHGTERPAAASQKKPRARRRSADSLKREAARKAASQAKRGEAAGRTTGRIVKVILVIWLLFLFLSIGRNIVSCVAGPIAPSAAGDSHDVYVPDDLPALEEDENSPEAQCLEIANTRLEHLMLSGSPEHAAAAERIATAFAQRVETDFQRTPDELGIDPAIVAEWVISSLIYKENYTNAFPEADNPYASVYYDVEACSMMTMYFDFQSDLFDYLRESGLYLLDIKQGQELDDAQKTDIAATLQAAMVETEARESSMCVRCLLHDGTWAIDEADFERYCDYVFGMPA